MKGCNLGCESGSLSEAKKTSQAKSWGQDETAWGKSKESRSLRVRGKEKVSVQTESKLKSSGKRGDGRGR